MRKGQTGWRRREEAAAFDPGAAALDAPSAIALILLAAIPYLNTLGGSFVYDDRPQLLDNPYVHSFRYLGKIFGSTVWTFQGAQGVTNYYRPLMSFAYLICYKLFGPLPFGFHLLNISLHVGVVLLVFSVSQRLFENRLLSMVAAGLFALHPIHTESVSWIAGITDLELAFFFLLTFLLFLRLGVVAPDRPPATAPTLLMLAAYAMALLSKEQALVLPGVAIVYEHFYRPGRDATPFHVKLSRYLQLCLLAVGYIAFRIFWLGGFAPSVARPSLSAGVVLLSAVALMGCYLGKLLWPAHLSAFYVFHETTSLRDPRVLAGLAAVLLCVALFFWMCRRVDAVSFAWLWMAATIGPVLNAKWMPAGVFAERYLYLPSVGFCWLIAWLATKLWRATSASASAPMPTPMSAPMSATVRADASLSAPVSTPALPPAPTSSAAASAAAPSATPAAASTAAPAPSPLTAPAASATASTPSATPASATVAAAAAAPSAPTAASATATASTANPAPAPKGRNNVAQRGSAGNISSTVSAPAPEGRHKANTPSPRRALSSPSQIAVPAMLALLALLYGTRTVRRNRDWRTEEVLFRRTLDEQPDAQLIRTNLGVIYWERGDRAAAEREWTRALGPMPPYAPTLNNMGLVRKNQKRYAEAIDFFQRAFKLRPNYMDPYRNLAETYEEIGQPTDADRVFRQAIALAPLNTDARNSYGHFLYDQGRSQEAEDQFRRSISADANAPAYEGLGDALLHDGKPDAAREAYASALAKDSFDNHATLSLAAIDERQGRSASALREYRLALENDPTNADALAAVRRLASPAPQH